MLLDRGKIKLVSTTHFPRCGMRIMDVTLYSPVTLVVGYYQKVAGCVVGDSRIATLVSTMAASHHSERCGPLFSSNLQQKLEWSLEGHRQQQHHHGDFVGLECQV